MPTLQTSIVVETDGVGDSAVELRQSAEILFRELKVRGLSVTMNETAASIVMTLSDRTLKKGAVELTSASLDRRALVSLEDAVDTTQEWIREQL